MPRSIDGFSIDSRSLSPGDLFVALRGAHRDGHGFLKDAFDRGASGAMVSREESGAVGPQLVVKDTLEALQMIARAWRQRFAGTVVGITGSVGKTSTRNLVARLLGGAGVHRTPRNFNNHIGVPLSLVGLDPDVHRYAVIELGASRRGEIEPLAGLIDATASLITNVAPAHLEGFATIENIACEKAWLGVRTRPDGVVVVPSHCWRYQAFRKFRATTVVLVPEGDSVGTGVPTPEVVEWTETHDPPPSGGCRLTLRQPPSRERAFELPPISPGMVANCALAIVLVSYLGVDEDVIRERLAGWRPARLRGEIRRSKGMLFYIDCYNASPSSMVDAFQAFDRALPPRLSRIYVLGCMEELGPASPELHFKVGRSLVLRTCDKVLVIGRDAFALRDGLMAGGNHEAQVAILESLDAAQSVLQGFEGAVLLKGSRAYALESLVPAGGLTVEGEREQAC